MCRVCEHNQRIESVFERLGKAAENMPFVKAPDIRERFKKAENAAYSGDMELATQILTGLGF